MGSDKLVTIEEKFENWEIASEGKAQSYRSNVGRPQVEPVPDRDDEYRRMLANTQKVESVIFHEDGRPFRRIFEDAPAYNQVYTLYKPSSPASYKPSSPASPPRKRIFDNAPPHEPHKSSPRKPIFEDVQAYKPRRMFLVEPGAAGAQGSLKYVNQNGLPSTPALTSRSNEKLSIKNFDSDRNPASLKYIVKPAETSGGEDEYNYTQSASAPIKVQFQATRKSIDLNGDGNPDYVETSFMQQEASANINPMEPGVSSNAQSVVVPSRQQNILFADPDLRSYENALGGSYDSSVPMVMVAEPYPKQYQAPMNAQETTYLMQFSVSSNAQSSVVSGGSYDSNGSPVMVARRYPQPYQPPQPTYPVQQTHVRPGPVTVS
ncbi:MAG: hypothetical protein KF874_11975 [Rhizobiaceae bacterium]|nr:hypothetical protein [Rhizobiaceae bacterium]